MAKYVVSVDLPNGVKAYASTSDSREPRFTFAFSESTIFNSWAKSFCRVIDNKKAYEIHFLHVANVPPLPAGLDWQIEEIE